MAIMIPDLPRDYDDLSMEGEMFNALKLLPDDYYVVHSLKNVFIKNNVLHESEADFVVINQKRGIICIEAKAGRVKYQDGCWKYSSDKVMKHGGPYNQAARNKWALLTKIQLSPLADIQYRCKFLHAVWFPSVSEKELNSINFPAEFDKSITMTKEALENPLKYVSSIYDIELENNIVNNLSDKDLMSSLKTSSLIDY